jgi:hypothetical protein
MKTKRILAAILAAVMSISLAVTSFAETVEVEIIDEPAAEDMISPPYNPGSTQDSNTDVNLQTALTKVKKRVEVPANLTEFSYTTQTNNSVTTYRFSWTEDGKNGGGITPLDSAGRKVNSMNVTIVGDIITRYNRNYDYTKSVYSTNGASLGKISVASFATYAKSGIEKLNPGMSAKVELNKPYAGLYSNSVSTSFYRKENGVKVSSNSGSVVFDKNTGDITNFSVSWWADATFTSLAEKISQDEIKAAYASAIDLEKQYVIKKDWNTKKVTAQITYKPETNYEFDAFTGKKSTIWEDYRKAMQTTGMVDEEVGVAEGLASDDAMLDNAVAEESDVSFSEAELQAIKENEKMIKKAEATSIILKDPYIGLTTEYQLTTGNLYTKNDFGITNYWDLRYLINTDEKYASISVRLDADSGKVISFSKSGYLKGKNAGTVKAQELDIKAADAKAAAAFAYYMDEKVDEYKDKTDREYIGYAYDNKGNKLYPTSKSYYKQRYHDNIIVVGETANINVNDKGEITSFSYQYTDVDFPSSQTLTQAQAYEKLWEQKDFDLYYNGFVGRNGKVSTYLLYNLNSFTLNAKTGAYADYYGDPIDLQTFEEVSFTDVKGTKYQTAVETLLAYGIYIDTKSTKFSANTKITRAEFNNLIVNIYSSDEIEITDAQKTLTKAEAARIYVQATGGEKYASMKGVWKSPYADVSENNAYVGYIAIAKAEGVFESGGNFNPDASLTRGDAILMIYEMVK